MVQRAHIVYCLILSDCTCPRLLQGFDFNRWIYDGIPYLQLAARDRHVADLAQAGVAAPAIPSPTSPQALGDFAATGGFSQVRKSTGLLAACCNLRCKQWQLEGCSAAAVPTIALATCLLAGGLAAAHPARLKLKH